MDANASSNANTGSNANASGNKSKTLSLYVKKVLICLSIIVLVVGIVLKQKPELCFRIPHVGFVVHILVTGKITPPYISMDCYKDMDTWIKDNDVIVSTLVKGGTTWMLYLTHLIRTRGNNNISWNEINTNTPWPAFIHKPGHTWNDTKMLLNTTILSDGTPLNQLWDHPSYLFRVFKAHEAPIDDELGKNSHISVLPIKTTNKKVKYLAMYRDLPDVLASFYPFVKSHEEEFRRLWGGFPPAFSSTKQMLDIMFKGPYPLGYDLLLYLKIWWKHRHESNVLLLHYNDAINDLEKVTRKLAKFYDVTLTDSEIIDIVDKASFKSMKAMTDKFSYRLWGNTDVRNGELTAMKHGFQIRKGIKGDSSQLFTSKEIDYINNIVNDYFKNDPEILTWSRNGGHF